MASMERTAYPRFRHGPNARELQDVFTPALAEIDFARSLAHRNEHFFAAVLLLKCVHYLGYFPELSEIPATVVNHVRIWLRQPVRERYTLLLCLIYRMRMRARDDAAEMFLKRMGKVHKQGRERLLEIQARQREKTENLVAALAGVIEAVRSDESSTPKVERIGQVFAGRGGIERLQEDCEAVQASSNNNYFPLLGPPCKLYRHLLFRLVGALRFVSTTQNRSLLDAVAVVQTNPNRRAEWVTAGDIDFSFVTDRRWNNVVFRTGKTAAFDGSLFELSEQNLLADFQFRYRLNGLSLFRWGATCILFCSCISFLPVSGKPRTTAGPFNRHCPLRRRHSARSKRRTLETAFGAVE